jgi:hypothetical protein
MGALAMHKLHKGDKLDPHVLVNQMERIEDETYWDIFEGYFTLGGHGIERAMIEHADELGGTAVSVDDADGTVAAAAASTTAVASTGKGRGKGAAAAAAATSKAAQQLDSKMATVLKAVDAITKRQVGYEKQTRELVEQQGQILQLLKAMAPPPQ